MKRPFLWITVLVLVISAGLSCTAIQPDRFTGVWYAVDGTAYQFQDGLVCRLNQSGLPEASFGGAYSFTRSSITLFVTGQGGLSEIRTLYWFGEYNGDTLRGNTEKNSPLYFSRNRAKAIEKKEEAPIG